MGHAIASASATSLQALLQKILGDVAAPEVYIADSYPALSLDLLHGRCDLAWGPPSVCARAEVHGARVLAQALRAGESRYRSAIVARRGFVFDANNAAEVNVAWVDADSTGGYLLACAWLRKQGVDPRRGLGRQRFYGSYRAAVDAVVKKEADLTSVFATTAGARNPRSALDDFPEDETRGLEVIAFTPETPSDGLAARPGLDEALTRRVTEAFVRVGQSQPLSREIDEIFRVDGFVPAGTDEYRALHDIVMSSM
jgi:phosphonate transport system substrate-binding protein